MLMKKNKYMFFGIVIVLGIVFCSCYSYYQSKFSYVKNYYKIKESCYQSKDQGAAICQEFIIDGEFDEDKVEKYIYSYDPKERLKDLDAITVTCEIVENTFFSNLQIFSPLIILIVVIGTVHSEFSSGNFENYLLRDEYKKYLRKTYKIAPISALLMPLALILVFLFSCMLTKFNFDTSLVSDSLAVYSKWKYEHFILYGFIICIIQFLISLLYANIGLMCVKRNKNLLVAIIMSYLMVILTYIFIYIILYSFILNKLLGFKEMSEYFNIIGYWFFDDNGKFIIVVALSFIFQFISFLILQRTYANKERLVMSYEKQLS